MTSRRTREIDGGSVSLAAADEEHSAPTRQTRTSISERRGLKPGSRVCLVSDSEQRGVLDSQSKSGYWAVRFADKSRNIHASDLKVLSSDAASFELSQAPLGWEERRASAAKSSTRGLSVAVSTNK